MEELITQYCATAAAAAAAVAVVHAPLVPAAQELGRLVAKTLAEHPVREKFEKLGVFGCVNKTSKISEQDRTKLVAAGALKSDSTILQDVSLCVTSGAAESAAAASLAARAAGSLSGFCAPVPGLFYVVSAASKGRAVFVPTHQTADRSDPVTLHVLHAPTPLTVNYVSGRADNWHDRMCGLSPIWWSKEGPCGQVMFPPTVNETLMKASEGVRVTRLLQEGDTLVMPPGIPLWFEGTSAILHSTTFCRVPAGNPNMESAGSEWHRWHRLGGICDPGPDFRGGAHFFLAKEVPPFNGQPAFPSDKSLVFNVDVPALQNVKPPRITSTETELLFWIGFVHKLMGAFQALESGLWSPEFEQKHREHLTDWLNFFLEPNGKIKHVIKTSTVRSALGTLCDTLEKMSSRALFFKEWIPRFDAVAPQILNPEFKFSNGSELENRRRETVRQFRELQKLGSWPKAFQHGKDAFIQSAVLEAEALLVADPNRWPQDPTTWLNIKRQGVEDFRDDPNIPKHKVDELAALIDASQGDKESCLAIDRAFHELLRLFDPKCGDYVSPIAAAAAAPATTKKPRKRSRSTSPNASGSNSPGGDNDDDDEIDIGDDDSELPVGSVVRDILTRKWNGNVSSYKSECASCHEKSVPLAMPYCVECCQADLHTLIFQSLSAGLVVLQKRGSDRLDDFKARVKELQKKERKNEHVFDTGHGRAEQAKVFKELLDGFAALQSDFATQGVVLAEHEDAQDLEEYGDASAMSCSEDEEEDEEDDEEEEEEEEEEESSYDRRSSKKKSKVSEPPSGAESLALDLLRFRQDRGTFIAQQEEMETLCIAGDEKSVAAARVLLDKLKALPTQWCVDIYDVDAKTTQLCETLGWFATEKEATKAMTIHVALHSHLKGKATFTVREKKNQGQ